MAYNNIREEELKNKISKDYFNAFDCTKIIGNVDFCVAKPQAFAKEIEQDTQFSLWAEAKKGKADIYKSITQLIITIGKARTFDKFLPPAYLGAFDAEKIGFIPYNTISDLFYINDFNWNVAPSNHETKEFLMVLEKVKVIIDNYSLLFFFDNDSIEINEFIKLNLFSGKSETNKIKIDKNNFLVIYSKWITTVRPTIEANWDKLKNAKKSILDCDFFLADLLSQDNISFKDNLFVVLNATIYRTNKEHNDYGGLDFTEFGFSDNQKAYNQFWNKYERPPNELYWDYILERRELLVPQDVREEKGSFFTPRIWVEKSQEYLTRYLGENWQDDYYIWDCAAGTGNLMSGLTNKYNIYASTLDRQDVDVMKDRILNGANLLVDHVFQFDFLNDSFDKLPKGLKEIIDNPEKRKKLVIYINPPYFEGDSRIGKGRKEIQKTVIHDKYQNELGKASGELFAQFFMRIYKEINGCILGEFSTLKILQAPNFATFRTNFLAKLETMFIIPADTFDNVKGKFPIGFMVWNTAKKEKFEFCTTDVYNHKNESLGVKDIHSYNDLKFISELIKKGKNNEEHIIIGHMTSIGNDFQHQNALFIDDFNRPKIGGGRHTTITNCNLIPVAVYFAVRKCIKATWLNDRDQFLYPNENWLKDTVFQNDCLTYSLFSNNIQSKYGINHWIPFTEKDVNARTKFESNCLDLFNKEVDKKSNVLEFSDAAKIVFDKGKELYKYYHKQKDCNANASLYDIRYYFQGRNDAGRMSSKSEDAFYNQLIKNLREAIEILELKIQPKIYKYGFLKG
jgi:hypothetical protein